MKTKDYITMWVVLVIVGAITSFLLLLAGIPTPYRWIAIVLSEFLAGSVYVKNVQQ